MHENAARALQYYEDLPRRSGRPELRLVDSEPRTRRRVEAEPLATEPLATEPPAAEPPAAEDLVASPEPRTREPRDRRDHHVARPQRPRQAARRPAARPRPRPRRQPLAPPRPQAAAPRLAGRPDRVAMWAVLLGFFLTAVAAATGHG
jgi:hypothetical protein